MNNDKIYKMNFSKIYPLLVNKATKKGRTKQEVDTIINWLTGYNEKQIEAMLENDIDYATFFNEATKPTLFKTQNKGALTMNNVKYIPYLSIKQQKKDELNKR